VSDVVVIPFALPTRAELEAQYVAWYLARNPNANPDDPQIQLDAKQDATSQISAYSMIAAAYRASTLQGKDTAGILDELAARGESLLPAAAAQGYVTVTTSTGGETIPDGLQIKINGLVYAVPVGFGGHRVTGDEQLVQAVTTGPGTDQPGGSVGTWQGPPPALQARATVVAQADGIRGLIGGADEETIDQARQRLIYENAHPAASGNAAEYEARGLKVPAMAVEAVFLYPSIMGAGGLGVAFTMRRSAPYISRIPSAAEIAAFTAWLPGEFPSDDEQLICALVSNPVILPLKVSWASAPGWADASPWPAYSYPYTTVSGATTPTPTTFRLTGCPTAPAIGQTIALFDRNGDGKGPKFRAKRILTATFVGAGIYDIVVDTSAGASDTTYTPVVGQPVGPWSVLLDLLVAPMVAQVAALGPGEQQASFWDASLRERRDPPEPDWPFTLGNRLIDPLFRIASVKDAILVGVDEGAGPVALPYVTPVGTPGTSSFLTELLYLVPFVEA
jgi:hypothetical protein